MFQWREEYVNESRPERQGFTAGQLFEEGKGEGLDPKALCFLTMVAEVKTVRRNRFTFAGVDWEGTCLYGYKGKVIIRYSLSDLSKIYVFDDRDDFMGVVTQTTLAHPIKDWQAAKRIIDERRALKRITDGEADSIRRKGSFFLNRQRTPDLIPYIKAEDGKKPKSKTVAELLGGAVCNEEPKKEKPKFKPPRDWSEFRGPWWERYDYHMAQDSATLSQDDLDFIAWFQTTSEYQATQNHKPTQLILGGQQ